MEPFTPADRNFEHRVRASFARQGIMRHIGARMAEVGPGHCEIHLPYGEHVSQQHGFFHGGIVAAIADSAAGYAAFSLMPVGAGVLSVEFKINLVKPADGALLIARGRVFRPGRTLTVAQAEVFVMNGGQERLCALMQQTLMTITGRADVVG
ncbi:MAG: PaaI family thioesterase [Rhodospirillales bacterium]|nr:MAG: PaaI family thioesterase [Rhodospirillales bacterium]